MMLLASFNLIIYGNISFERTREISIISNMKFLNYDVSNHGKKNEMNRALGHLRAHIG